MTPRLVIVTWIDASDPDHAQTWYSGEDLDKFSSEEVKVTSVGFIKSDTKLYLTIAADYIAEEDGSINTWSRPTKIPHGMIQTIQDIPL